MKHITVPSFHEIKRRSSASKSLQLEEHLRHLKRDPWSQPCTKYRTEVHCRLTKKDELRQKKKNEKKRLKIGVMRKMFTRVAANLFLYRFSGDILFSSLVSFDFFAFLFFFFACLFVFLKSKMYILTHIRLCRRVSDKGIFTRPISGNKTTFFGLIKIPNTFKEQTNQLMSHTEIFTATLQNLENNRKPDKNKNKIHRNVSRNKKNVQICYRIASQ